MTTRERYFGAELEQACQRPGYWLIEGYHVKRRSTDAWDVFRSAADTPQTAIPLFTARALTRVREWISDRLESPQAVTYQEAILEGANPDEGFYE